jgi:rod shape-determining protein MreC
MENFFVRYKNPLALMAVVIIQVVALATQVKRPENARAGDTGNGTRLIRVWTVTAFTPIEKMFVSTGHFFRDGWHNYADLRGVRKQNHELQDEVSRLQMEQVRLKQDADQARRLQALLEFKERFISRTVAAQVIGTSGSEQSRVLIIDKGSHDGIKTDMAVITPDGIVGKIKDVFPLSAQVLLINDHDSGAGVILERSRLQGIVKGTSLGELQINDIMSDEKIEAGDHVITSGGDRIYPKGYSVGTVINAAVDRDNDPFLVIKIKPAADLRRLEEVMVVTKIAEEAPTVTPGPAPMRAADILAQRLPSVPKQDANAPKVPGGTAPGAAPGATAVGTTVPATPAPKSSPTPAKVNLPTGTGTEQKPGNVTNAAGPAKQPASGTGTATSGASTTTLSPTKPPAAGTGTGASPTPTKKTGVEGSKPASAGQTGSGSVIPAPTKKTGVEASKPAGAGQTGSGSVIPAPTKKTGVEASKPASSGQTAPVPAGVTGTDTPPVPKPKATPKKPAAPAKAPDPGASEPKASDRIGTVPPAATPSPTPENLPR